MSLQTTLKGCYGVLRKSAKAHRDKGDAGHAAMCDLQADLVLKYLEHDEEYEGSPDLKETSGED